MSAPPPPEDLLQRFTSDASPGHANVRPRDASTLILLDRSGPAPKVLMGKRHHGHDSAAGTDRTEPETEFSQSHEEATRIAPRPAEPYGLRRCGGPERS